MTKKRFTIEIDDENIAHILDNETDIGQYNLCKLLNELHEENQKLKKENAELEKFRYSIFKRMGELYEEQ